MRFCLLILTLLCLTSFLYADSKTPDACKLLTQQDVQSAVGAGYPALSTPSAGDWSACIYRKSSKDLVGLTVFQSPGDAAIALEGRKKMAGKAATPVQGLGAGAFLSLSGDKMGLNFGKGSLQATIEVYSGGKPSVDVAKKLAALVYSRLP